MGTGFIGIRCVFFYFISLFLNWKRDKGPSCGEREHGRRSREVGDSNA